MPDLTDRVRAQQSPVLHRFRTPSTACPDALLDRRYDCDAAHFPFSCALGSQLGTLVSQRLYIDCLLLARFLS